MSRGTDKPILNKLDDCRVVHWSMRNKMFSREGRYDDVRQTEAKLRGKALNGRGVAGVSARVSRSQIAMQSRRPANWHAWAVAIRIYRDLRDIRNRSQRSIREVV